MYGARCDLMPAGLSDLILTGSLLCSSLCGEAEAPLPSSTRWPRLLIVALVVQDRLNTYDSAIPWAAARQASLSFTISQSVLKLISIESVMPSNFLILCCPLLHLPSIFPSIRIFSNESALCIRWPKYWSFSIGPSNECSGLTSLRINWLDLLAVQVTLKSLLQHHNC